MPVDDDPDLPPDAPSEYLNQLLNLISRLRGGSSKYQLLLVAKVSENLPLITPNIPTMTPNSHNGFLNEQGIASSITLPTLAPATIKPQQQTQSPFGGFSPFPESSRGLMFDGYSPSVSHASDMAVTPLTPPVGTSPHGMFGAHSHVQPLQNLGSGVPRSVPTSAFVDSGGIKYEGYHG